VAREAARATRPTTDASVAGNRGRCGCDMRLFSDEWNRREWDTSSRSQHQAPALPVLSGRDQVARAMRCTRARLPKSQPHITIYVILSITALRSPKGRACRKGLCPLKAQNRRLSWQPAILPKIKMGHRMQYWCSCPRSALAHVSVNGLPVPVAVRLWRCHDSRRVGSPRAAWTEGRAGVVMATEACRFW